MIVFIIILLGFVLKSSYRKPTLKNKNYTFLFLSVIIIHSFTFLINHLYIDAKDSIAFYERAVDSTSWLSLFDIGTKSMSFIIYPLTQCGFNYFSVTLLCSVISLKGYFIYLELFSEKLKNFSLQSYFLIFVLLSPSIHIWTSSLYKESILFTLMAVILKELWSIKPFNYKLVFSILIITLIRPYISLVIITSMILVYRKVIFEKYKIVSLFLISIITIASVIFLKIRNLSSFKTHFERIINYSSNNGNSSINLLNSNYFERLFLVISRPLFYDSKTFFQFFVSVENLVFAIILIIFTYKIFYLKHKFRLIDNHICFTLVFSITCIFFYSIYMYNLGLASRMRVMFVPYLLIGMHSLLDLKKI